MGCTSSTPSHVDSSTQHGNSTDIDIETSDNNEDLKEPVIMKVNNNIVTQIDQEIHDPVLPERDIREKSLDVICRNDSLDSSSDDVVENNRAKRKKIDEKTVINVILLEKHEAEQRKLRELQFVEELSKISDNLESKLQDDEIKKNIVEKINTANDKNLKKLTETIQNEMSDGEDVLSESSRTTRWEALADVASELPPSLAVDPHTGQIYTLK